MGSLMPDIIRKAQQESVERPQSKRDSAVRKRQWWLPYVVLEFDKNEILIDGLGGDLSAPVWNYRAHLCVEILLIIICHLT